MGKPTYLNDAESQLLAKVIKACNLSSRPRNFLLYFLPHVVRSIRKNLLPLGGNISVGILISHMGKELYWNVGRFSEKFNVAGLGGKNTKTYGNEEDGLSAFWKSTYFSGRRYRREALTRSLKMSPVTSVASAYAYGIQLGSDGKNGTPGAWNSIPQGCFTYAARMLSDLYKGSKLSNLDKYIIIKNGNMTIIDPETSKGESIGPMPSPGTGATGTPGQTIGPDGKPIPGTTGDPNIASRKFVSYWEIITNLIVGDWKLD